MNDLADTGVCQTRDMTTPTKIGQQAVTKQGNNLKSNNNSSSLASSLDRYWTQDSSIDVFCGASCEAENAVRKQRSHEPGHQ
jgi:hypothetical protein